MTNDQNEKVSEREIMEANIKCAELQHETEKVRATTATTISANNLKAHRYWRDVAFVALGLLAICLTILILK